MTPDRGLAAALVLGLALLAGSACREVTTELVSDPAPRAMDASSVLDAANGGGAQDANAIAPQQDASAPRVPVMCGDRLCACDDGADSDGDGLIDGLDPECTGPFDDDEQSFATGLPLGGARCRDCFWDDNAGSGDDDCRYAAECLLGEAPTGKGNCSSCEVSDACVDSCGQRTPNGCDCFGCCDVTRNDGSIVHVSLSESCSLATLDDTSACPRCVQNTTCRNPCGRCELCPGRRTGDLPADCVGTSSPQPAYACDEGEPVCSDTLPCSDTRYCQLGCCLPTLF